MKRKLRTLVLALILAICVVPMGARAAEEKYSGYCGTAARWTLYGDGTLVISGTGAMDFRVDSWHATARYYGIEVTKLVVEDSFTDLRAGYIQAEKTLKSVSLPATIETLDEELFKDYTKLTEVKLREGTTTIGKNAFAGCTSLTSITLPDSITEVQSGAFADCRALERVTMPAALKIGGDVFEGCDKLKELYVDDLAAWIAAKKRDPANPLGKGMDLYIKGELLTELVIPEGTTEIGWAFIGCTSLTKVTVPGSVKDLSDAFVNCTALQEVILGEGITNISYAFSDCPGLTKVVMHCSAPAAEGSFGLWRWYEEEPLTLICTGDPMSADEDTFEGRTVTAVYYPADNDKWDVEDGWWKAFSNMPFWYMDGCSEATSGGKHIAFTDKITCTAPAAWSCALCEQDIGTTEAVGHTIVIQEGYAATCTRGGKTDGKYCSVCKEVLAPQVRVGALGHTFPLERDCYRCGEVLRKGSKIDSGYCGPNVRWDFYSNGRLILSGEGPMYEYLLMRDEIPYAKYFDEIEEVIICEGVTAICDEAFRGCSSRSFMKVSIPPSVTHIGRYAFANSGVESVTIPTTIAYLGAGAFYDCNYLYGVTLSTQLPTLYSKTFAGCEKLTSIIIPGSVSTLEDDVCGFEMETVILDGTERFTKSDLEDAFGVADFYWLPVDNKSHTYGDWEIIVEATCETKGTKVRSCVCGETQTQDIPARGHNYEDYRCTRCGKADPDTPHVHSYGDWNVTTPASCEAAGVQERTCGCGDKQTEAIPAKGHTEVTDPAEAATCTIPGKTEGKHCSVCDEVITAQTEIPAKGHKFEEGTCTVCGDKDPDYVKPTEPEPTESEPTEPEEAPVERVAGTNRISTALTTSDKLKEVMGVEKYDTIVVADAMSFPDALSGSYLAAATKAPILLYKEGQASVVKYVRENLKSGGKVYVLGGTASVPDSLLAELSGIDCERVAGSGRLATSLLIIAKADALRGTKPDKVLICDGRGFADSLSASATGLPILLVNGGGSLNADQKAYLESVRGAELYVIGGKASVSEEILTALNAYDANGAERIAGNGRELTSVEVAKKFFPEAKRAALASSLDFPDGLSGGPVAYAMNMPLLLTREAKINVTGDYVNSKGITSGYIIGGESAVPDAIASKIFAK